MLAVFVVEDDEPFSELLTRALSKTRQVRIVGASPTAEDALREIPRCDPDVVLLDLKLPRMNGIECLRRLKGPPRLARADVLILTDYEDTEMVFEALKAGANGYLLKDRISFPELSVAIKDVTEGGAVMSPRIARKVIQHFQRPIPSLSALSKREMEVLVNLSRGLMYKEIAADLSISMDTVRSHIKAIYGKLHVRSRAHATRRFHQRP